MKKVLLLGATGLVGGHALARLRADPRCGEVVALTRRPLPGGDARVRNVVADFEHLPDAGAPLWRVDAVVCALGSTMRQAGSREAFRHIDHDYPLRIARLALEHGAQAFALNSAAGADAGSRIFYSRVKGELERDLQGLGYPSLTLVRPGLIGGQRAEWRSGERLAGLLLGALQPLLPRAWRISPAARVAEAPVEAALAPAPGVHVVGPAQLAAP